MLVLINSKKESLTGIDDQFDLGRMDGEDVAWWLCLCWGIRKPPKWAFKKKNKFRENMTSWIQKWYTCDISGKSQSVFTNVFNMSQLSSINFNMSGLA